MAEQDRRQFLKQGLQTTLGLCFSSVVVSGFSGCDSTTSGIANTPPGTVLPNSADNNYVFNFSQYPTLQNNMTAVEIGVAATSGQKLISVVRIDPQTVNCVEMICTFAFCYLNPMNVGYPGFTCPCHGCTFNPTGSVVYGPASSPLVTYPATLSATGITVNIA
jgi:Rieske Fe-S protein